METARRGLCEALTEPRAIANRCDAGSNSVLAEYLDQISERARFIIDRRCNSTRATQLPLGARDAPGTNETNARFQS